MKTTILQKAKRNEAIGTGNIIYSSSKLTEEEGNRLRENISKKITREEVEECILDLAELGAVPSKEDALELLNAKGLLQFDKIKNRIIDKSYKQINTNEKDWEVKYRKQIRLVKQRIKNGEYFN